MLGFQDGVNTGNGSVTVSYDASILTVSNVGSGSGLVTSDPAGIYCGGLCSAEYGPNAFYIVLTATADFGSTFVGWTGECTGTDTRCLVQNDDGDEEFATARFEIARGPVTTISGPSKIKTRKATARGTFTLASEPNSTFECAIDTGLFETCTASFTTDPLPRGQHMVHARATDEFGLVGPVADKAFSIVKKR
jgi:hypothetical protein